MGLVLIIILAIVINILVFVFRKYLIPYKGKNTERHVLEDSLFILILAVVLSMLFMKSRMLEVWLVTKVFYLVYTIIDARCGLTKKNDAS